MNIITSPRRSSPRKYTLSNYSIAVARWNVILTLQGKNLLIRIQRKLPSYDFLSNTAAKLVSIRENGLTWIVPLVFFYLTERMAKRISKERLQLSHHQWTLIPYRHDLDSTNRLYDCCFNMAKEAEMKHLWNVINYNFLLVIYGPTSLERVKWKI